MKEYIQTLFFTPGITQSLMVLTLTMAVGHILSNLLKIRNFSLGVTWILFCGILCSHFGMVLEPHVAQFAKDFGLILFVYSIGLQVGPSFFSSFSKGGLKLNLLAMSIVLLACACTFGIYMLADVDWPTMVGVMSGAVTNTPSLGAAEQAYSDLYGAANPSMATGYAVAYPLGVVGIIGSMLLIRLFFRIRLEKEDEQLKQSANNSSEPVCVDIRITNPQLEKVSIAELRKLFQVKMVVSRVIHADGTEDVAKGSTVVHVGDIMRTLTDQEHIEPLRLLGEIQPTTKKQSDASQLISRRIVVTKEMWNGKHIGNLDLASYHATITRVNRAGIELLATPDLTLQLGDRLMIVGDKDDVQRVADLFGNELKRLDIPHLLPIFIGIVLGVIVGTLPIPIPGLSQAFKLGLAGGSLIVAILIGRYGPYYHMVTFATTSANKMIREIGISLFLAAVGLGAGESFVETVVNGGYMWILYGVIITLVPLLLVGVVARKFMKLNYYTLMGLIAGSTTDPPALAYAMSVSSSNDQASVSYATVYPLTMFLRVMMAQLMILLFA